MVDTQAASAADGGSAPASTLSIPKERFDEVNSEVKRLREELGIKDRLITESQARMLQPQRPAEPAELTPEETGLDPTTHAAVMKVSKVVASRIIAAKEAQFGQQIGALAGRTEKAELIATRGSDKAKYLGDVEKRQQDHWQRTGQFLPADIALDLILMGEKDARIAALEKQLAGGPAAPAAASQGGLPNAAATREIASGGGAPKITGAKSFGEMNLEEMEADLERRMVTETGGTF